MAYICRAGQAASDAGITDQRQFKFTSGAQVYVAMALGFTEQAPAG